MTMSAIKIADLTIDELRILLRDLIREAVYEALGEHEKAVSHDQWGILTIPSLQVDPRHPALTILSREQMYSDDGR